MQYLAEQGNVMMTYVLRPPLAFATSTTKML
jgi:hypothetical protein